MKAFAAVLAFALCSSGILVQGGLLPGLDDVTNVALNLVQGLLENLTKILSGLVKQLPNVNVDANTALNNVVVSLGGVSVQLLEDNNILDLEVDNATILISDGKIDAIISITNLNVPGLLNNASITDQITIDLTRILLSFTVKLTVGLKPLVSDIVNIQVNVDTAVALATNINSDILNLALGANLPIKISAVIGKQLEENKQALIDYINNNNLI